MKRIISAIIALVMLVGCLPVFAEADNGIVGDWYVSYVVTPEGVLSAPGDAGYMMNFVLNDDGSCVFTMEDFEGRSSSPEGTWTVNAEGRYDIHFTEDYWFLADIIDGQLVACGNDGGIYYCTDNEDGAQRVITFSDYSADAADADFFGDWVCGAVLYAGTDGGYEYYSKYIIDADFTVSIGIDSEIGGYVADWYIGGVGGQVYNENVLSNCVYEYDETGDAYMYSPISLSNGINTTTFMYLDDSKETLHVYGLYGILVFTRADALPERPALIEEVFSQHTEQ